MKIIKLRHIVFTDNTDKVVQTISGFWFIETLRGLTPPHRVKSISMATFTTDEIDVVRSKGNDHCKRVWLGLYEGVPPTHSSDEQQIRDFMVEKYERKRYYMEKAANKIDPPVTSARSTPTPTQNGTSVVRNGVVSRNGNANNNLVNGGLTNGTSRSRPEPRSTPTNNNLVGGFADFDKADIFSSASNTGSSQNSSQQNGFADFEHNAVFSAATTNTTNDDDFSIFDLQFTSNGPTLNQVPLFPRCRSNRWSMPTPAALNAWTTPLCPQNGVLNGLNNTVPLVNSAPPPVEDKYAALKDLDNEMKQLQQQDAWSSSTTGSTGSLYSSSTPTTGSVYGSPSPQSSLFGSPSQGSNSNVPPAAPRSAFLTNSICAGQFMTSFAQFQENNPFGSNPWAPKQPFVNPFREQTKGATILQPILATNGASNGFSSGWGSNPFKMGTVSSNANNPFL
ncbi:arf GTPase activating protein drongo isoform X5 [Rhynchophorus ferrugineus]|uniref:arf GTPase activating protein drongo isoform X5 n=1 Tax=Rhynchophorus ferrugineus TaxID=354439 RepID=UPI003FCD6F04